MSDADPNFKRLGTIIFLFIIVLAIDSCQYVFLNEIDTQDNLAQGESLSPNVVENLGEDEGIDYIDFIVNYCGFFVGTFLVRAALILPFWMYIIILPIYLILILVFWYIIIDFIKDISILGSGI